MQLKRLFSFIFCLLLVSSIYLTSFAEDQNRDRKKIRENINTLRLLRMTQALDLTEEQTAKIFPALNRIEKEKTRIHNEIGQKLKELRLILAKEKPEDQEIEFMIENLKKLRSSLKSKDEELEKVMEESLTLVQRAKYLIFSVDFFKGLREKIAKARRLQQRSRDQDKSLKK